MPIDWFTVGAQALNFLILVWLMKRFLYHPILHAIDAREKLVADGLAKAAAAQTQADASRDEFTRKNTEFDQQRTALLAKATAAAAAERGRLLDEARHAADALRAKRSAHLAAEAEHLHAILTQRTQQEVFAIARKTLADLATTELEERACAVFVKRLRALADPARSTLIQACSAANEDVLVRSAFALPEAQRASIRQAVNEICSADIPIRYQSDPALVGGIELQAGGRQFAWSIADYLAGMASGIDATLSPAADPAARTEDAPAVPAAVAP